MTAQRKIDDRANAVFRTDTASMFDGEGTRMFSSGSAPAGVSAMLDGAATGLFSSGSAPRASSDSVLGEVTGLFSSGS